MGYIDRDENGRVVGAYPIKQHEGQEYVSNDDPIWIEFQKEEEFIKFYNPIFEDGKWVEGMPVEEIIHIVEDKVINQRIRVANSSGLLREQEEIDKLAILEAELADLLKQ